MKIIISTAIVLLLAGCVSTTMTADELKNSDFGPYPTNYQNIITNWANDNLKDPYSAHYEFQEPVKTKQWTGGLVVGGGYVYEWQCDVQINAKNSYGGW